MKTFFNILQRVVNTKIIRYPDEPLIFNPFVIQQTDIIISANIYSMIYKIYNEFKISKKKTFITKFASSKFFSLNNFLINPFNSVNTKQLIFEAFSKAQRTYFALVKFVNIYKLKKYKKVVTDDL